MTRPSPPKARRTPPTVAERRDLIASVDAVRRLLRALRLAARDTLASTGVSSAQLFVLGTLANGRDASISELAERTMTDRTSVTAVVNRLLEAGLATKRISAEDRRRAAVRITPRGRALLRKAPPPPTTLLIDALQRLDRSELRRLAAGLVALTRTMAIDAEPTEMLFEDSAGTRVRQASKPRRPAGSARAGRATRRVKG